MADYAAIAKLFEDRVDGVEYYETRATLKLKNELFFTVENETRQLLFLVGVPGCGKSVFLSHLPSIFGEGYRIIKYDTPFFDPVDFIRSLIQKSGHEVAEYSLEEMIHQAVRIYKDSDTIVAIDEAQLLSKEMIELIRILSDSKAFWFLLAMHKHESKKILSEPQFSSRPHRVLTMDTMEFDETSEYISKELLKAGAFVFEKEFSKGLSKEIYKISKGNFRDTKKILNRMFLMMDYAIKTHHKKYQKPSRCLVTMAAIDGGLLDI